MQHESSGASFQMTAGWEGDSGGGGTGEGSQKGKKPPLDYLNDTANVTDLIKINQDRH